MVCANNGGPSPHIFSIHTRPPQTSVLDLWIKLVPLRFQQPQCQMLWHGSIQYQPLFLDFSLPGLENARPSFSHWLISSQPLFLKVPAPLLGPLFNSSSSPPVLMQFLWSHGAVPSTEKQICNFSLHPNPKCPSTCYLRWESKPQAWHPLIKFGYLH